MCTIDHFAQVDMGQQPRLFETHWPTATCKSFRLGNFQFPVAIDPGLPPSVYDTRITTRERFGDCPTIVLHKRRLLALPRRHGPPQLLDLGTGRIAELP